MTNPSINILHEIGLIIIAVIIAYFIYRAYAYLGDLDNCNCAPQSIVQNLKMIELYYLCILLAGIVFNVIYLIFNLDYTKLVSKYNYLVGLFVLYILSVFGFYIFYVYNVIKFKQSLDPNCGCANQWQNDIIYVHVLYLSLPILLTILSALFKFKINTSVLTLVIVSLVSIYYYENYMIKHGKTMESMVSMLGNYRDMAFEPTIYVDEGNPFDKADDILNPDYGDFSPHVGQPLQKYHQKRPDDYPAADNGKIQTPLSTHESISMQQRIKTPKKIYA
jgi:hypothetical protein